MTGTGDRTRGILLSNHPGSGEKNVFTGIFILEETGTLMVQTFTGQAADVQSTHFRLQKVRGKKNLLFHFLNK